MDPQKGRKRAAGQNKLLKNILVVFYNFLHKFLFHNFTCGGIIFMEKNSAI